MKPIKMMLAGLALAAALSAFGQDAGPEGARPQASQGRGQAGGPMGRRPMGGPRLLLTKEVIAELKLTDAQIEKIKALRPQRGGQGGPQGAPEGPGRPERDGRPEGGPEGGQQGQEGPGRPEGAPQGPRGQGGPSHEMMQKMQAKLKSILSESQFARFQQIELQAAGPHALLRPDVAEKLGLSEDQRSQIEEKLHQEFGPDQGGQGGQSHEAEVMSVLTREQSDKWKAMLGKPFKLPRGPQGRPGGPEGREGGQGPDRGPGGPEGQGRPEGGEL